MTGIQQRKILEIKDFQDILAFLKKQIKNILASIFILSFIINICMLLTGLYSLQVLDRVLNSRSLETLVYLTLIVFVLYIIIMLLQNARSFILMKLGEWLDNNIAPLILSSSIRVKIIKNDTNTANSLREFQIIKSFITSPSINSFFDVPWSIIYIIILFYIHSWMGWIGIIGSILIIICSLINSYAIRKNLEESNKVNIQTLLYSDVTNRNAEIVQAMGMMPNISKKFNLLNNKALHHQSVASYRNGVISNFSRYMIRMVIQMLVTGIGAYLVLTQPDKMTMGEMIASSIFVGRALTPFDNAIEIWKQMLQSIKSYKNLKEMIKQGTKRYDSISLPTPKGILSVENIYYSHNNTTFNAKNILKGLSFELDQGDILAIMGPSASGKTTLAKLLLGVLKTNSGTVRLDGADIYYWNREQLGQHVGYLPQDIELFNGSIKDNIARFNNHDIELVHEAAKITGIHDFISLLPDGYDTELGIGGTNLSGGQRQRIGLARAFYGNPKFIVLDEPNASLDKQGEQDLEEAIQYAKSNKITTIIISHRPSILAIVNKILLLQQGSIAAFGDRYDIMARINKKIT